MGEGKISANELRKLRNDIPLKELCKKLKIPCKIVEDFWRFSCPLCNDFNTAINPKNNLGRCFKCNRNMNTIDVVMLSEKTEFLEAVKALRRIRVEIVR